MQKVHNSAELREISEISEVLGLKDHPGWQRIVRDAEESFNAIGATWFNNPDGSRELQEARISAISNKYIIDLMPLYEAKLNEVGLEVIAREDNSNVQVTDVDQGIVDDESDE